MNRITYRNIWKTTRILGDIGVVILSFLLVYFMREHLVNKILNNVQPLSFYLTQLLIPLFILILVFKVYGLYDEIFYATKLREIYLIFRSLLWLFLFLVLYFYIFQIDFSRLIFFFWMPILFIFLVIVRLFIKKLQIRITN